MQSQNGENELSSKKLKSNEAKQYIRKQKVNI